MWWQILFHMSFKTRQNHSSILRPELTHMFFLNLFLCLYSLCGQSFGFGILLNMTHKQICFDCKKPVCSHCCVEIANSPVKKYEMLSTSFECLLRLKADFFFFPFAPFFSTEASAYVMSVRKYETFTRRRAHGSTKVYRIMSFRAMPMVIRIAMSSRNHQRSRRQRNLGWKSSLMRTKRTVLLKHRKLSKTVRLAMRCSKAGISSIFVCQLTREQESHLTTP